ncbi:MULTISPECIES: flagellar FlbD family protein [unclassified Microbacterium]|uniref:flagellar FlbD family protein n=1 Tax=unclassified Microbacterium TaxID=2609290 RepID=UPI0016055274|nr:MULTISPECIES: flagellar FlbD family protein [unclassified Microbacterium]QNA92019.1 flagellar FlbD family protein [Microbacterium sp. Se63.02b]QYM65252.1 flagellar FlbD family protein [Microbacterium sp. Se5.02b]
MIVLTRLNRSRFAVNPDLIERVQATPDTTLIMVDGATFVVTETMDDVIAEITRFRAGVLATAAALIAGADTDAASADTEDGR